MGYDAYGGGTLRIKKENFHKVIEAAIKHDSSIEEYEHISTIDDISEQISTLLGYYSFQVEFDENGNIEWVSREYSRLSDDDGFFASIAPYIDSLEIDYTGEDDAHWRYAIRDGEFNEYSGVIVYPDDPTEMDTLLKYISNK